MLDNQEKNKITISNQENDLGIIDIFRILLPFKKMIIAVTTSFAVFSIIYSLMITPVFVSKVVMVSLDEDNQNALSGIASQLGGLASIAGIATGTNNSSKIDNAIAILGSRTFIQNYLVEENLMPVLFSSDWEEDNQTWSDGEGPSLWKGYEKFERLMDISKDPKTGILEVSISWSDPVIASKWANDIVNRLDLYLKKSTVDESQRSVVFLEEQLAKTKLVAAESMLYSLIENETRNIMFASARENYLFKIIDKAIPAETRTSPVRKQIVVIGTILGFIFVLLIALMLNFYHNYRLNNSSA